MDRRQFFKRFGAGAASLGFTSLAGVVAATPTLSDRPPRRILETKLAGYPYYAAEKVLGRLKAGDALKLRANPKNRHDPRAVEIWWRSHMLGHVPKHDNASVAQLLADGEELTGAIRFVDPAAPQWERIGVDVWLS